MLILSRTDLFCLVRGSSSSHQAVMIATAAPGRGLLLGSDGLVHNVVSPRLWYDSIITFTISATFRKAASRNCFVGIYKSSAISSGISDKLESITQFARGWSIICCFITGVWMGGFWDHSFKCLLCLLRRLRRRTALLLSESGISYPTTMERVILRHVGVWEFLRIIRSTDDVLRLKLEDGRRFMLFLIG